MGNVNLTMPTNTEHTLLSAANHTLAISLAVLIVSIVVSYPLSDLFSLNQQIISHVLIIISASALKLAYVGRCVAQNEIKKQEC
ncbi:MAG: hypothetical protein ACJA13_004072 [Paraglaciecola sp.]|jgi:hypothetical protein